jgi:hypothetical protein
LEENMATKDQLQTVLDVVTSIDQQLKDWQAIPAKVDRLHKRVFSGR